MVLSTLHVLSYLNLIKAQLGECCYHCLHFVDLGTKAQIRPLLVLGFVLNFSPILPHGKFYFIGWTFDEQMWD